MPAKSDLLGKPLTAGYRPSALGHLSSWSGHSRGRFGLHDVEEMRWDPRIRLGLRTIKAPISVVQWAVVSQDPAVQAWVDRQFKHIWRTELSQLLLMIDYGRSGGEAIWRLDRDTDLVEVDCLKHIYAYDLQPLEQASKFWGIRVKSTSADLPIGRCFHLVNEPEISPYWGRSRLSGAWAPWMEKSGRHGAIDSRRLWYVKNAYRGGIMRHPEGMMDMGGGVLKSYQDYAREMAEKGETGQILVFPNSKNPDDGAYLWIYEEPKINGDVSGIREYVKDVDREILEGLEVFPEVVEAVSTGSWAGRTVPFLVFLTSEDAIADNIVLSLDRTVIRPGAEANFGRSVKYKIELKSLVPKDEEQKPSSGGQGLGGLLGGQPGQGEPEQAGQPEQLSLDAGGREHKGKGERGGQFGSGGSGSSKPKRKEAKRLWNASTEQPRPLTVKGRKLLAKSVSATHSLVKEPDTGQMYHVETTKLDAAHARTQASDQREKELDARAAKKATRVRATIDPKLISGVQGALQHGEVSERNLLYMLTESGPKLSGEEAARLLNNLVMTGDIQSHSSRGKTTYSVPANDLPEQLSLERLSNSPWTRYSGPHGGHGWKHGETGEVVYQEEMPGGEEGGQPTAGDSSGPASVAGIGGVADRIEAAITAAKSRKELAGSLKAIGKEANKAIRQMAKDAVQAIKAELNAHPKELRRELVSVVAEYTADFANDLIGHVNHEVSYTVGQLRGKESKAEIQEAIGSARENLGPAGIREKFDFNARYLHSDLNESLKTYGYENAPVEADRIVNSLAKRFGLAREQLSLGTVRLAQTPTWTPYIGKRGAGKGKQIGWKHVSGRIVYGDKPNERKVKAEKPTVEGVTKAAKAALASPTRENVLAMTDALMSLKLSEMRQVRVALGAAAGGRSKEDLRAKIAEKVQGTEKPSKPASKAAPKADKAKAAEEYKTLGVKAPAFKSWFGDWEKSPADASKVIDPKTKEPAKTAPVDHSVVQKDGKPVTVYHGTPWDSFEKFKKASLAKGDALLYGPGFYFTENPDIAEDYKKRGSGLVSVDNVKLKGKPAEVAQAIAEIASKKAQEFRKKLAGTVKDYKDRNAAESLEKLAIDVQRDLGGKTNEKIVKGALSRNTQAVEALGDSLDPYIERAQGHVFQVYLNIRKPFDVDRDKVKTADLPAELKKGLRGDITVNGKGAKDLTDAEWQQVADAVTDYHQSTRPKSQRDGGKYFKDYYADKPYELSGVFKSLPAKYLKKSGLQIGQTIPESVSYKALAASGASKTKLNAHLATQGHDGITHLGHFGARGGQKIGGVDTHRVWIAFDPADIKSVDNAGTFDPKSASIRMSAEGEGEADAN